MPPRIAVPPSGVSTSPISDSTPMKTQRRGKSSRLTISATVWPVTGEPTGMRTSNTTRSPLPTLMRELISGYSRDMRKEFTRMSASLWTLVAPTSR